MPSVDNRVVRMEFDNTAFDTKVKATLVNLQQLDKALKLQGAQKGLVGVTEAAKKVDLSPISTHVEGISAKFLALSTVAITALANITNKAIGAGAQIAKSLSLDQVIAGFSDYELKIGATQTIMAGTGENIGSVTKNLKDLDVYADKTIYNLRDMVGNIGKFTNAGVKLPVATQAMIGIANAAALSGANSEEASRAMYNLGQAIGQGTVRLMDWKSVELANMGTLEFKQQLIDSAVAAGTLKKGMDGVTKTSKGTVVNTKNFGTTLQDAWLTSEALTKTLQNYASTTTAVGKKAWAAAQNVKTFSMMSETLKASISTGWTDTFDIIIGNLTESTKLFTGLTNYIGGFFGKMATRRNALLKGWKDFGGRALLLDSLRTAFFNILKILAPIRKAFREIFPHTTVLQLLKMTTAFSKFAKALKPNKETVNNLYHAFKGFFAVLSIGWTILKEGTKFLIRLGKTLLGLGGPGVLEFAARIGDVFTNLRAVLVKGGGIVKFFNSLTDAIAAPIGYIKDLVSNLVGLFTAMDPKVPDKFGVATGRVGQRVKTLSDIFDKLKDAASRIFKVLSKVGEELKNFFVDLGKKIAGAMGKGDFNKVLDIINVGLLGGILIMLRKFFKKGIKFDIGGGFLKKIGKAFEQLTGVLKAMQTELKAKALKEIAIALGILTLSIIALSLIDSVALTKALTAMAVGFGQLMATFAIITKMNIDFKDVAKFTLMAVALGLMSAAILLLAASARILATLNWDELAKGLGSVGILLGMLVGVVKALKDDLPVFIGTSLALIGFAIAINILFIAVRQFAKMDVARLAQGMIAAGISIGGLVLAMKNIPDDIDRKGMAVLKLSFALFILGIAVGKFARLNPVKLAKGLGAATLGLYLIAKAMSKMPEGMKEKASGVLAVSIALILLAKAMEMIGKLPISQIASGIITIAVIMEILVAAMEGMQEGVPGASALLIIAGSLILLAFALKTFASIPFGDLVKGLLSVVAVIAVLAGTAALISEALPAMMGLGIALLLIGGGFALFGIGAFLAAKAIEALAQAGKVGAKALLETLKTVGRALPELAKGFAEGTIEFITMILEASPKFAKGIEKLIGVILDAVIKLIPKFGKIISLLIMEGAKIIRSYIGEYIKTGIFLILSLLEGIRGAIPQIVVAVGEIIVGFLDAMSQEVPRIIESLINLWITILNAMAEGIGRIMATLGPSLAVSFFTGFLQGLEDQFGGVWNWFMELPGRILDLLKSLFGIGSPSTEFISIGADLMLGLLQGLVNTFVQVFTFFTELPGKILELLVTADMWLINTGIKVLQGLANGFLSGWHFVTDFVSGISGKILDLLVSADLWLIDIGSKVIEGLKNGFIAGWHWVSDFFTGLPKKITDIIGSLKTKPIDILVTVGGQIIEGLANGVSAGIHFLSSGWNAIMDKIPFGWGDRFKIGSPSKLMMWYGEMTVAGLRIGMMNEWDKLNDWWASTEIVHPDASKMNEAIKTVTASVNELDANPTITPVLDLSRIREDASKINGYISTAALTPSLSINQARMISADTNVQKAVNPLDPKAKPGQVNFHQTINAPEQLSTADIYKQTRNQITMAKEALKIP